MDTVPGPMNYRPALCIKHLERGEDQLIYIILKFTCKLWFHSRMLPVYWRLSIVNRKPGFYGTACVGSPCGLGSKPERSGVVFLA